MRKKRHDGVIIIKDNECHYSKTNNNVRYENNAVVCSNNDKAPENNDGIKRPKPKKIT